MDKKTKLILSGVLLGALATVCAAIFFAKKGKEVESDFEDEFADEFEDELA